MWSRTGDSAALLEQRILLQQALGDRGTDLAYSLGGWSGRTDRVTGRYIYGRKEKWKPNTAVLKAVVRFVKATRRLEQRNRGEESLGIRGEKTTAYL